MTRGEVWLAHLDTRVGHEGVACPCLIVSPGELSDQLNVVTVAPLKPGGKAAGFRVRATVAGDDHAILLDQLTTLDQRQLVRRLDALDRKALAKALAILREMFAE